LAEGTEQRGAENWQEQDGDDESGFKVGVDSDMNEKEAAIKPVR